mgnify:CR=1 FL=1
MLSPSYHVSHITIAAANELLDIGLAAARQQDMAVSIAIVDRAGLLVAFARMDQAAIVSINVAQGKARTAASIEDSSELFEQMINQGQTAMLTVPDLLPLKGGLPLIFEGKIIGAVGVSGSSGENDLQVAQSIANAL